MTVPNKESERYFQSFKKFLRVVTKNEFIYNLYKFIFCQICLFFFLICRIYLNILYHISYLNIFEATSNNRLNNLYI